MSKYGNSSAEDKFIETFCELYGPEKGQYVYMQYPCTDIYGRHRTIDFAFQTDSGKIAIEIDGTTWHDPSKVSEDKYEDDLLKQNSIVFDGWKIYRWTDKQLQKVPERVKDELLTFLGASPELSYLTDDITQRKGSCFEIHEHQEEALSNLQSLRANDVSIALVQGATGTGKSAIGVLDAKAVGGRTLFLAHTKELVNQGYENFKKLWPEVSIGRYYDEIHDLDSEVICGSIQSISKNLDVFSPTQFDYLIIDECHHGAADTYRRILGYFKASFTLGLTATPEREDGQDLLEIFQNTAHKFELEEAVEKGILSPVRCVRIKTNIDLQDVRINGFKYNSQDLESKIHIPERNALIVDTYLEYVNGKSAVIFCTSVEHADTVAELLRCKGIKASSISGRLSNKERNRILSEYENSEIKVLCACDLLNEGWDSPHTEVLFMARPTMSKTIYLQQLGRGMRTFAGKECLLVFDFVDNANMFNCPYSMHRLFNINKYNVGGLVLGKKTDIRWEHEMFAKGERPDVIIDFPVHAYDYEIVDLFNWQDRARDMLSVSELTRCIDVRQKLIRKYIREGKIQADLEVPFGNDKAFLYFNKERVAELCSAYGWREITASNRKDIFIENIERMQMDHSYKPVFLLSFFEYMDENGIARIDDVLEDFIDFYEERKAKGLFIEKDGVFTLDEYTKKDVLNTMLTSPFKIYEEMGVMRHAKCLGCIQLDKQIAKKLSRDDVNKIRELCIGGIKSYYSKCEE